MKKKEIPEKTARKRSTRSSHEVRTLILKAARELFAKKGYDATTTRDISKQAGVTEALLFTNFGSKAGLFDAAVVTPFSDLVGDYVDSWNHRYADSTPEQKIGGYIENFFDLAQRNRALLLSALVRRLQGEDQSASGPDALSHLAAVMSGVGREIKVIRRDYPEMDADAEAAVFAGMVLGVALLDDMLFPADSPRLSRARIVSEMTQTVLHGVGHRTRTSTGNTTAAKKNSQARPVK